MTLSSIPFIFQFLPVFLISYFLIPKKWWRTTILFLGSLFFFVWIDPNHIHVLIASILFNYLFGIFIQRSQNDQGTSKLSLALTIFSVICNIAVLVFYKYTGFILQNLTFLIGPHQEFQSTLMPLGISYFTFTGISYLVDVHQQIETGEKNFLKFANYLIMFPKIMLGPITRYSQINETLPDQWFVNSNFAEGVKRFIGGLGKKVILADNFAIIVDRVFNSNLSNLPQDVAWFGLIAYALQIFFDFSGYTDMALGLGLMLGYKLPENFNFPYIAKSISDFWRRWHISLTSWFRTYIFIPLEFKQKKTPPLLRQPINIIIVFLLTGIWHGAGWNFLIWGGYYGVLLALEAVGWGKILKKAPRILQHAYTILAIVFGWVFFKIGDIKLWGCFFKSLFGINTPTGNISLRSLNILLYVPLLVIGILFSTPIFKNIGIYLNKKSLITKAGLFIFYLGIFILSIGYILSNGYLSFLYIQF